MRIISTIITLFIIVIGSASAATIVDENFDSYNIGTLPSGWILKDNGSGMPNQAVDNVQYVSSPNSLKLEGGDNKSAIVDYTLSENDKITFEADIRVGQTESEGIGANIGLVDPDVGTGIRYAYIDFKGDVLGLASHDFDRWYHIKAKVDMANRTYDFWLDAHLVADYLPIPEDGNYKVFRLEAYKNTKVWFDNIKVYTDSGTNTTTTPTVGPTITTVSPTITTIPEDTSTPEKKTPGFEGIITIIGLFLIYVLKRK